MIFYDVTMMKNLLSDKTLQVQHNHYYSYLLRIWQTKEPNQTIWYFSLENPLTHEIKVFQDVSTLTKYLTQTIEIKQAGSMK